MKSFAAELDREMQTMAPDAAQHFEQAVRAMLRLAQSKNSETSNPSKRPYEIKSRSLGLGSGLSYDNVGDLLAKLEGEDWK
jgi:hypothetical protein